MTAATAAVQVALVPLGITVRVRPGESLQDTLFAQGVEFPCGGRGRCKGCRVRVISGQVPATPEDVQRLSPRELAAGWRLACALRPLASLTLELAQWDAPILGDDTAVAFTPRDGLGVAVDLGTTTLVAQLLDLRTGRVQAVRTALNAQAQHGGDIMSRVEFACGDGRDGRLTTLIRRQIGDLIASLLGTARCEGPLTDVVIVGNTVMHHLFGGRSLAPLAHHPFEPEDDGLLTFTAAELDWAAAGAATVHFLPCLGGFVGSDILAGILATGLAGDDRPGLLVDLGTNGEIVVGSRDRLWCASTAAGPAFEGARISQGMRAATGAVSTVTLQDGTLHARVVGGGDPRGICGSGLVDAVACGLNLGRIQPTGRITGGDTLPVAGPVRLTQWDVRELQLAKGAIAAGIQLLLDRWGTAPDGLRGVWLAGAFGNYISRPSARRIGLLDFPPEQVEPAGNTALRGAKLALFNLPSHGAAFTELRARTRHLPLNDDPRFHEVYVDAMRFPDPACTRAPVGTQNG